MVVKKINNIEINLRKLYNLIGYIIIFNIVDIWC